MNSAVEVRYSRLAAHRLTAHKMRGRGAPIEAIADHLRVSTRSVGRYLAAPRPEAPAPQKEVMLTDFYMQGACGSFPEYNWMSRSSLMQKECKAICAHCPVLAACREYGLTSGVHDESILGGLSVRERRAEARRRVAASRRAQDGDDNESQGAA
jgi:WhiB family redox-sensing transcriptional regulator